MLQSAGIMPITTPSPLSFVLLSCESHSRDIVGDKSLERAFQSLSLKQRLEAIQTAVARDDAKLAFLPGSGAIYMSGCKYAVVEDRWMAIFVGCVLPSSPNKHLPISSDTLRSIFLFRLCLRGSAPSLLAHNMSETEKMIGYVQLFVFM
jgi:hypothetical protein